MPLKRLLPSIWLWSLVLGAPDKLCAQLPDGSQAPDFALMDLEGETWALSSLISSGKSVILNFATTWCTSCWAEAHAGALNNIHSTFGPAGSNDVVVLFLEFDDFTNLEDLDGSGATTSGNWLQNIHYPIVDGASATYDLYGGTGSSFCCVVCPNGAITNIPALDFDGIREACLSECNNEAGLVAPYLRHNGPTVSCVNSAWPIGIDLFNLGSSPLTEASFKVYTPADTVDHFWTGSLDMETSVYVDLGTLPMPENWTAELITANNVPRSLTQEVNVAHSVESTTSIRIELLTDAWPEESGWQLTDDSGQILEQVAFGNLVGQAESTLTWDVNLMEFGCYKFTFMDAAGDGLNAAIFGDFTNGFVKVHRLDAGEVTSTMVHWDGGDQGAFFEKSLGLSANSVSNLSDFESSAGISLFPNPTDEFVTLHWSSPLTHSVDIEVFDSMGRRVDVLIPTAPLAGKDQVELDLQSLKSGVYFLRVGTGTSYHSLAFHKR